MIKKCRKCENNKMDMEFSKDKRNQDGLHSYCKECRSTYKRSLTLGDVRGDVKPTPGDVKPALSVDEARKKIFK